MSITIDDIEIGSTIMVKPEFGTKPPIRATVTGIEAKGHDGQDVIDYINLDDDDDCTWAFMYQVVSVITK